MTATALQQRRQWVSTGRVNDVPDKLCTACGAAFFTNVGLAEHARKGCGNGHGSPVKVRKPRRLTPDGLAALQERGRAVTALNNSRRFHCVECGKVSTPSGVGSHQRSTGHTGRVEL